MKPPRVFHKRDQFWLDYYEHGKLNAVRKSTGIELDIEPPKVLRNDKDWWKKSKHKNKIFDFIRSVEQDRYRKAMDLPDLAPQTEVPNLNELLHEYNEQNAIDRDAPRSRATLNHRKNAVDFLIKWAVETQPKGVRRSKMQANPNDSHISFITVPNDSIFLDRDNVLELRAWAKSKYSPFTVRGYFLELRLLSKYAVRKGYIQSNPFEGITVHVTHAEPKQVGIEDEDKFFTWLYHENREAYRQAMFQRLTFVRISDTCLIESARVNRETQTFTFWNGKAKRPETVGYGPALAKLLSSIPKEHWKEKYLFHYRNKHSLVHIYEKANEAVGNPGITSHQLKRSGLQEVAKVAPDPRTFEALAHHAPTVNVLAVDHYSGRIVELMQSAVTAAQKRWETFQTELYRKI